MKGLIQLILLMAVLIILGQYCESRRDPYEEGTHWDYRIECESGYVYKVKRGATMQVYNSDGTPLKCGNKRY